MRNLDARQKVDQALYGAVYWGVDRIVPTVLHPVLHQAVYAAVGDAVTRALYGPVHVVLCVAIAQRPESPHPGLGVYLAGVAG